MSEVEWQAYQRLLKESRSENQAQCIGCWYDAHPGDIFPGDILSSSLCDKHANHLPGSIKTSTAI